MIGNSARCDRKERVLYWNGGHRPVVRVGARVMVLPFIGAVANVRRVCLRYGIEFKDGPVPGEAVRLAVDAQSAELVWWSPEDR